MADQIAINIYLKDGGTTSQDTTTGTGQNVEGISQVATTQGEGTPSNAVDLAPLRKYVASQTIDVFLNNTTSFISSNIGLMTGRTELQQKVNFGMQAVQQGVNTYKNAQAGAVITSTMGMGGTIGAVVGAVASILNLAINTGFKQAQLQLQQGLENKQLQQITTRAGANVNRSREGV